MVRLKKRFPKYIYALIGLFVVVAVIAVLEFTNTTHFFRKEVPKPIGTTGGALTKGTQGGTVSQEAANAQPGNATPNTPTNNKQPDPAVASTNGTLLAPWGTFFNNTPVKTSEQMGSTCNTTTGAACQIIFTNEGSTKTLPAQSTDAGGAVYWSWKPSDIGLTPGIWHVSAKATLGSQTKTTSNDPLTLEIQ